MKALSIIIPSYNVEKYISHCLGTIEKAIKDLEVIIVNDGSKDKTLKMAKNFQKNHKDNVRIIDKQNGGHGSTINAAMKLASGKYLRILDSDDWLNEEDLEEYIKNLKESEEDLILTNYTYNYVSENKKETVDVYGKTKNLKNISEIKNLDISDHDFISLLAIHSCTIKTENLKKVWDDGLLEKTFYEDQEFIAKVILASKTIKPLNLDVYQYMIGRDEQSMSSKKLFQKRKDHEKVLKRLVELYEQCEDKKREIMSRRIREMFKTHYWIYFYHNGLTKNEKREFGTLQKELKKKIPDISKNISNQFRLRLFIGRLKNTMLK